MKQKTAMQELIEDVELIRRMNDSNYSEAFNNGLDAVINLAKGLIPKERQQIIDAYDWGWSDGYDSAEGDGEKFESAEKYYNETYEN